MTDNPTTAPTTAHECCIDQTDERYWHQQGGAYSEEARLLADFKRLEALKAKLAFARTHREPGRGDRIVVSGRITQLAPLRRGFFLA